MGLYGIMDEIIAGSMGSGWWFQPTALKNDGVRQLGSVGGIKFPTEWNFIKMFQSTNQIISRQFQTYHHHITS
jgi:hypothetical protein